MNQKQLLTLGILLIFLLVYTPDAWAGNIYPNGEKPSGLVFGLSLFFAMLVPMAIHELGHLLMGLALGFRFELFVVFLLGIKRTPKGIRVYLNKNLGYMGGVAATVPVTRGPENRKKFAWTILAGPLASLLFAMICLLLALFTTNILWSFLVIAGAVSFALFLATTLPNKTGIFFTDRARFQRLISKGVEGKEEEAMLELIAITTLDNGYKNISLDDTKTLQNSKETFVRFWGYYFSYEFFKANENPAEAENAKAQLNLLKDAVSNAIWKALKLDE